MSAKNTMISIKGLTKDFGSFRAVDNISFDDDVHMMTRPSRMTHKTKKDFIETSEIQ